MAGGARAVGAPPADADRAPTRYIAVNPSVRLRTVLTLARHLREPRVRPLSHHRLCRALPPDARARIARAWGPTLLRECRRYSLDGH